jgi:hypothetical protein
VKRSEHKRKQEEEVELLKKIEIEEELKIIKKGMLNIQLLAIKSPSHSSSNSECAKGKAYNAKIKFV